MMILPRKKHYFVVTDVVVFIIINITAQELLLSSNAFVDHQFKYGQKWKYKKQQHQQQHKPSTTTGLKWSKYITFDCEEEEEQEQEQEEEGGNKSGRRIRNCPKIKIIQSKNNNNNNNIYDDDDDDDDDVMITYDLSSPREWLEYWEIQHEHHPSPYTVLRCDYDLTTRRWNIWGREFHFQRLKDSLLMILLHNMKKEEEEEENHNQNSIIVDTSSSSSSSSSSHPLSKMFSTEAIDDATKSSISAMDDLLKSAEEEAITVSSSKSNEKGKEEEGNIITFMTTLLWNPEKKGKDHHRKIQVFAHIFSSLLVTKMIDYNPNPIVASVAINISPSSSLSDDMTITTTATTTTTTTTTTQNNNELPNRYQYMPSAKLSSWCRRRRPIEKMFKKDDNIGEVLLIRDDGHEGIVLLEGLTTNLFVVYKDGSIRTANTKLGVLNGYVRNLIIQQCAQQQQQQQHLNLNVDTTKPIKLEESDQWQELFITSSIRLVVPIREIVVIVNSDDEVDVHQQQQQEEKFRRTVWTTVDDPQQKKFASKPIWRQLYERIICSLDVS